MTTGRADKASERRNYFRLHNNVLIEFRPASNQEVRNYLSNEKDIKAEPLDVTYELDNISRQLSTLIQNIRQESNATALYLELLNKKVDYLGSMITFEKIRNSAMDGKLECTETLDISEGGMSFLSTHSLNVGQHIYCKLAIMGYRLGMETFGKVIRSHKDSEQNGYHRIGVEFPYLRELDKKNLTRYIFDKQREILRLKNDHDL